LKMRNKYSFLTSLLLSSSFVLGCSGRETRREVSDILHEDAIVVDVVYTPSRHGSGAGLGPTIDFDGNIGISFSSVSVNIPEKYAVVFKCEHGKFISAGTDARHKELWERLQEGQDVDVTYREIFESTYEDIDKDGKKDLIKRKLIAYDFLDAQLKEKK